MIPKCIKQRQVEEKVDKLSTYSIEEQVIGKWIDGKKLYRKVVIYTPSATIGEKGKITNIYIPHNISNIKQLCHIECITSDGHIYPTLGSESGSNIDYGTRIAQITPDTICLRIINDTWGPRTWYITLEYTKTTD